MSDITTDMEGGIWVPVRRLCKELGISSQMQILKLKSDPRFVYNRMVLRDPTGRKREMTCIPENQVELFKSTINPNRTKSSDQYVYFIEVLPDGFIKIGLSNDPVKRLAHMQTSFPYELQLLGYVSGDYTLEKQLHEDFKADHIKGEWFKSSKPLEAKIQKLLKGSKIT